MQTVVTFGHRLSWFWAVTDLRLRDRKLTFHIKDPHDYNTCQVCDHRVQPIFTPGLTSRNEIGVNSYSTASTLPSVENTCGQILVNKYW